MAAATIPRGRAMMKVHEYFAQLMRDTDTVLYGRKTYELMVPFWPDIAKDKSGTTKAMNDFADAFASVDSIVVCSRSLEKVEGKNTSIIRGNLKEEVLKLNNYRAEISLPWGVDIPSQLMRWACR